MVTVSGMTSVDKVRKTIFIGFSYKNCLDPKSSNPKHILNCLYEGPAKGANQEQIDILQEVCPHLVPEVTILTKNRASTI